MLTARDVFVAACGAMSRFWRMVRPEGVHALGAAQAMVVTQEKQSYETVASDVELRAQINVRCLPQPSQCLPLGPSEWTVFCTSII